MSSSNTAQVLSSLAEGIEQDKTEHNNYESLRMCQDAFEIFEKCLKAQEEMLTKARLEDADFSLDEGASHDEDTEMADADGQPASPEEKWVAVVEEVNEDTILDTIIELVGTMTNICALICNQDIDEGKFIEESYHINLLERIDEYFKKTIYTKLHTYIKPENPCCEDEIMLAVANYTCAYAEASFRTGRTSILNYDQEVKLAFSPERLSSISTECRLLNNPEVLCDMASARISFAISIQSKLPVLLAPGSLCSLDLLNDLRWAHLTIALEAATHASKQEKHEPGILPRIHLLRGDCEVLRYRLREPPCNYVLAVKSREKLLKNADKYYRGAAAIAQNENEAEEYNEATAKAAVVWALLGFGERLGKLAAMNLDMLRKEVEDMGDEELLSKEDVEVIRKLFPWQPPDPLFVFLFFLLIRKERWRKGWEGFLLFGKARILGGRFENSGKEK